MDRVPAHPVGDDVAADREKEASSATAIAGDGCRSLIFIAPPYPIMGSAQRNSIELRIVPVRAPAGTLKTCRVTKQSDGGGSRRPLRIPGEAAPRKFADPDSQQPSGPGERQPCGIPSSLQRIARALTPCGARPCSTRSAAAIEPMLTAGARGGQWAPSPADSGDYPPKRGRGAGWRLGHQCEKMRRAAHRTEVGGNREMRANLPTLHPGALLQVGALAPGLGVSGGEAPAPRAEP
jgi:hypothetical protein